MPDTGVSSRPVATPGRSRSISKLAFPISIFALALAVRLPLFGQSLWGDEMATFLDYIVAPWQKIVAGGPGDYSTNNHPLFLLLAKVCYTFCNVDPTGRSLPGEGCIRFPSLIAGALLPLAFAWPFRRQWPMLATLLAIFASLHPWLIAFSDEARGYSLMLLLGVIATNLLPDGGKRWPILYGVILAAMLYTLPLGLLLIASHCVAILLLRRGALRAWIDGILIAGGLTLLLYLPLARAIFDYVQHPVASPKDFVDFANQLPRFAIAGQYLPHPADPVAIRPEPLVGVQYWVMPVLIAAAGSVLAWKRRELRPMLIAFGATAPIALIAAVKIGAAGQVRYVSWSALWICICLAAIVLQLRSRLGKAAMYIGVALTIGWMIYADLTMPPSQPIREALALADEIAPPGTPIVAALLTAPQAVAVYGSLVTHHKLAAANDVGSFLHGEAEVMQSTGHRPCVVVSYEYIIRQFRPDFWQYLNYHYKLAARLPGRITPCSIFEPRP